MKNITLFISLVFSFLTNKAEFDYSNLYVFAGAGSAYYQGDLNGSSFPTVDLLNMSYKGGVGLNYHTRFGVQLHYTQSSLNGSDLFSKDNDVVARGLSFTSPLREFGINFKVRNLNGREGRVINYVFTGVNYFSFDPSVSKAESSDVVFAPESGFKKSGFNIPMGLGLGYWVTPNIGVVWETGLHILYTDYLDGVSKNGNPDYKDGFVDSHILVMFRFGDRKSARSSQRGSRGFKMKKVGSIGCPRF